MSHDKGRRVFGLRFSEKNTKEVVSSLLKRAPRAVLVFTANVDHIVRMRRDHAFKEAYVQADIVTADGMPVFGYLKWCGINVQERVTGADIFSIILPLLSPRKHRPFFVVSNDEVAKKLERYLAARGFGEFQALVPPFGFELDRAYSSSIASSIRDFRTTHLFFCVGAPKSEQWLASYKSKIGNCVAMAVGMAPNFFVGDRRRAPRRVQRLGLEWLWRFCQEPRRLFRRYFIESWGFLVAIVEDILANRSR